jgi:hypothetical protein
MVVHVYNGSIIVQMIIDFVLFVAIFIIIAFCLNRMCKEELDDDFDTIID